MKEKPIRVGHIVGKMMGGGVESMVLNYYRHIDRTKVQFDFIVNDDSTVIPTDEITSLGGRIYNIPTYKKMIEYDNELFDLLKKNQYPIVHSHVNSLSVFPLRVAKKAKTQVRIAHSHSTSAPGETKKNIAKNILRPYSKLYPTDYMACSNAAAKWLFGSRTSNYHLIKNGIETSKFRFNGIDRKEVREELGLTDQFVIGHTGRLCFQKNQQFLIHLLPHILKERPNTVLLLLGDGEDREILEDLVIKLDVQSIVLFLGNKSDVHRYYSAMDVFVFPSKYEGFGISSIEAQVSGLPVIQSKQVPVETKISDHCIFLNHYDDYEKWVDEILKTRITNRSQLNQAHSKYEIKNSVKELEDFYLEKYKGSGN